MSTPSRTMQTMPCSCGDETTRDWQNSDHCFSALGPGALAHSMLLKQRSRTPFFMWLAPSSPAAARQAPPTRLAR